MNQPTLGWDDTIKPQFTPQEALNFALSPENRKKRRYDDSNGVSKRSRTSAPKAAFGRIAGVRRRLEALSQQQLVNLMEKIVDSQPELAPVVDMMAPPMTVEQALNVLSKYYHAIIEKIPLGGTNNDYAFLRVRHQWMNFFAALADYLALFTNNRGSSTSSTATTTTTTHTHHTHAFNQMSLPNTNEDSSKQPIAALEFLDGATKILIQLPVWENHNNNVLLMRAFSQLSTSWSHALEEGSKSVSFAVMTKAAWDAKFQKRCEESRGRLTDNRFGNYFVNQPVCQSIAS